MDENDNRLVRSVLGCPFSLCPHIQSQALLALRPRRPPNRRESSHNILRLGRHAGVTSRRRAEGRTPKSKLQRLKGSIARDAPGSREAQVAQWGLGVGYAKELGDPGPGEMALEDTAGGGDCRPVRGLGQTSDGCRKEDVKRPDGRFGDSWREHGSGSGCAPLESFEGMSTELKTKPAAGPAKHMAILVLIQVDQAYSSRRQHGMGSAEPDARFPRIVLFRVPPRPGAHVPRNARSKLAPLARALAWA